MKAWVLNTGWIILCLPNPTLVWAQQPPSPRAQIEETIGAKGTMQPGEVPKVALPRTDFTVLRGRVRVAPTLGLTPWMAFKKDSQVVVAQRNLCLREAEINPVLTRLQQGGIEVTAFWKSGQLRRWTFEGSPAGTLPSYVAAPRGHWTVQEIPDASTVSKALVQVGHSPRPYFNLALVQGERFRDLRLTVKMKALSGEIDQGGGLVWRYQDPGNYYVARVNPLEDNFRVYRVKSGKREMLGSADVQAEAGKWHTLSITMEGNQITCELNGRKLLDVTDDTFQNAGQVGVWTKADANTAFDDLVAESLDLAGHAAAH